MNLRLAFNWDKNLLDNIKELPVKSMFGIMPSDIVGGGRPTAALRNISKDDATDLIREIRSKGISFNYLLNAVCLDNKEFTKEWTEELVKHLDWLVSCGVDALTVSIPYLIQFIKKNYPDFRISTSIFDRISTVERARYFEDLGADDIVLDPNINRELKLIGKMRKAL
ncbi:MAG TPA: U32 family peptidase, partial [Bacteroidales bacterium]|nr:U32 family peptidase [Bacteroidales bacterium]